MKVLHTFSEIFPLLKTGGLADVCAALPPALKKQGCDVRILIPGFPSILAGVQFANSNFSNPPENAPLSLPIGHGPRMPDGQAPRIIQGQLPGSNLQCYVLDAPSYFDRIGNPYSNHIGEMWPDNAQRFALLGWAAACLGQGLDKYWEPDILHCHDWHTGLAPLYMRQNQGLNNSRAATVFTIHNLAYQGVFPREVFSVLGLPDELNGVNGIEFHNQVSFMKAALLFSDSIATVSPSYAREILTPSQGVGLDGVLRSRNDLINGILNGVDYCVWNPEKDTVLEQHFDSGSLEQKKHVKKQLQKTLNLLPDEDALILGVVSRLTEQKGLHLLASAIDEILHHGVQLALIGEGEAVIEQNFLEAALKYPGQVHVKIGYDEDLAHLIVAGSDVIAVPSRFEPCGLTQLYGLRYGTLPLVHKVGGLADTVVDVSADQLFDGTACGFVFDDFSVDSLQVALKRAFKLYAQPKLWRTVQQNAMKLRFDWQVAAGHYLNLYKTLTPKFP